jgi:N-carbamoylputrescine amidase
MTTAKIAYVQWPEHLLPHGATWDLICRTVDAADADILITNEMPFGVWLAESPAFDADRAQRSIELHDEALDALRGLNVGAVVSSRPVAVGDRLANEAFVLEGAQYRAIHHKQYFPQEKGFFEQAWFVAQQKGFECVRIGAVRVGVMLCTELYFNEHARHYGRLGADLIVTPRASGTSHHYWKAAGAMAAIVSGAYWISSNRHGPAEHGQVFGGAGLAMSPEGVLSGQTTDDANLMVATIDLDLTRQQKSQYPCYVAELPRV